jgi:hypothetical protein
MPPLHRKGTVARAKMVGTTTIPLLWRGGKIIFASKIILTGWLVKLELQLYGLISIQL